MKISVKVKSHAKQEGVEKIDDTHYVVSVKEPPIEGRANYAVTRALSGYLGISLSRVNIVSGHTSKNKTIEIL
jgi:uncharacterized protein YggU (UPF0235/DUF167 family)